MSMRPALSGEGETLYFFSRPVYNGSNLTATGNAMSKCNICGNRFIEGEPDFYFCPACQKKYHKGCFERFGCTDRDCPEYRGFDPIEETEARAPAPLPPMEKGLKGALKYFSDYNDSLLICPECGKKVSVFVWNYRLGCPVHSCLERKEHLYLRAGVAALALALVYAFVRTGKLFLDHAVLFALAFAALYWLLIHLGMYVKIKHLTGPQLRKFGAGLAQGAAVAAALAVFTLIFCGSVLNGVYQKGMTALNAGQYEEARDLFKQIPRYRDSKLLYAKAEIKHFGEVYRQGKQALDREDYGAAIQLFGSIDGYMDSKELLKEAKYKQAKSAIVSGDLKTAVDTFTDLGSYKDSRSILKTITEKALPALGGAVMDMIKPSEDDSEPGFWGKLMGN